MFWSLSFQLLPDETIIDDSDRRRRSGVKPAYSVFLTNRRTLFRFDGLGSSMTQSFFFDEIMEVSPCNRLFFSYLKIRTNKREFLINTADVDYWTKRIAEMKAGQAASAPQAVPTFTPERKKRELLDMLTALRRHGVLSDSELDEKIHLLDSLKL